MRGDKTLSVALVKRCSFFNTIEALLLYNDSCFQNNQPDYLKINNLFVVSLIKMLADT
jgi:hypothetical protein